MNRTGDPSLEDWDGALRDHLGIPASVDRDTFHSTTSAPRFVYRRPDAHARIVRVSRPLGEEATWVLLGKSSRATIVDGWRRNAT